MKRKQAAVLAAGLAFSSLASAAAIDTIVGNGGSINPVMLAGAPPDSPAARVDPNLPTSAFTGVVSINIRYDGLSFICSGTAITPRHVLTAGHCVDTTGNGNVIDLTKPGSDVRIVLNGSPVVGDPLRAIITANKVTMNPNYQGFGNCPPGVNSFCVNDDLAIIEIPTALPAGIEIYGMSTSLIPTDTIFTMVGYGRSGNGIDGFTLPPDFRIKRTGQNIYDIFDTDDEQGFSSNSPAEVWYYDFDGIKDGVLRNSFCELGLACSQTLPNNIETNLGGGDSGGPSFILVNGKYVLVANNTFGLSFCPEGLPGWAGDCDPGNFGDGGGGVLIYSYMDWIRSTIHEVSEPGAIGLLGLSLLMLSAMGRRRRE